MVSNDFEIRPGAAVGPFELGSSLWAVVEQLRTLQHVFPQVDIKYDPDTLPTTPIIIHARPHFDLLFSGHQQRLHTICIRHLRDELHPPLVLRYKDTILTSETEVLRRVGVNRTFGPTYPGEELRYPGVWFAFDDDGRTESRPVKGAKKAVSGTTDERDQEVKKIVVGEKDFDPRERDVLDEVQECRAMDGDIKEALVKPHDGVIFRFFPSTATPVHVQLGQTSAQDLTIEFGPPLRVHYKDDDRMNIHSRLSDSDADAEGDYFYNYFHHGVDFLLSGVTHLVKKIVIHTNVPGTAMFQRYKRCPWAIEGRPEDDEDDSPPRRRFHDTFEEISHFLSPREQPPSMLLNRTDEEEGLTLPSSTTELFGYDGIVLEVAQARQVVTVMLF